MEITLGFTIRYDIFRVPFCLSTSSLRDSTVHESVAINRNEEFYEIDQSE
jgi:hypothetical protein